MNYSYEGKALHIDLKRDRKPIDKVLLAEIGGGVMAFSAAMGWAFLILSF